LAGLFRFWTGKNATANLEESDAVVDGGVATLEIVRQ